MLAAACPLTRARALLGAGVVTDGLAWLGDVARWLFDRVAGIAGVLREQHARQGQGAPAARPASLRRAVLTRPMLCVCAAPAHQDSG